MQKSNKKVTESTDKDLYFGDLINYALKYYESYELDRDLLIKIYDKLPILEVNVEGNSYYDYLFLFRKYIDNYIVKNIQDGNDIYQILLAENNINIVYRYLTLKKLNNYHDLNELNMAAIDLADEVVNAFITDYNFDEHLDKQFVKQLNRKFN